MYIPEEKIAEVLNTSDIVDVISESVILKKSGRNFFGLCPFHSEKTPSFSVNASKQIFHCFGCSAGGNVLTYIMKYHGISFPEAVKMLARKYNITVETGQIGPEKRARLELKETLFRLNKTVMKEYAQRLQSSPDSESARNYLKKRGTSDDIIQQFRLGFAPDAWDSAVKVLRKQSVSKQAAVQSGLVLERKQSAGFYDRFRNRIIFPIFDINMQVAGFGGRVMDDSMPKYMNSPETPVYNKSRILYGLHESKQYCRQEGVVFIVEGYFDFLSMYQHGIKNCVATLGTALTSDHVRILKGYAKKMILVFDSDAAGINAAKRSVKTFIKEGVDTRVLVLPDGNDPDSFLMVHGAEAFEQNAEAAKSVMHFLLQVAMDTHGLSIEGRIRILDDMKEHLMLIQDSALRSLHVKELAEILNIDEKAVLGKVKEHLLGQTNKRVSLFNEAGTEEDHPESDRREEQMISMMLNYPDIIDEIKKTKVLNCFYSDRLRDIAQKIISVETVGDAFITTVMAHMKSNEDQELIASFAMNDFGGRPEDVRQSAMALIQRIVRVKTKQDNTLNSKIISAEKGSDAELTELLRLKQEQIRQLHGQ